MVSNRIQRKAVWGRSVSWVKRAAFVLGGVLLASSAAAQTGSAKVDEAIRKSVVTGESTRVIMQFDTTAERDAAFNRLLDRGAAVRTMDTGDGPALNVLSSAATAATEFDNARQVSYDAPVSVFNAKSTSSAKRASTSKSSGKKASTSKSSGKKTAASKSTKPARDRAGKKPSKKRSAPTYGTLSVAVVDSGLQPQADLPEWRVRKYVDFVSGGTLPIDRCGHGTHVAGTIAGNGEKSGGKVMGVDPDVDLVVLRVLGDDCSGNTSDVIDALEWIAANHAQYNIRVVNMSLGHPVFESAVTDPLVQAVERLSRKGIVVVTAAGNMGINPLTSKPGYGGVGVPCNAPSAVCVGALDTNRTPIFKDDKVANFSSRGPSRFDLLAKPDLVAEGVRVVAITALGSRLDGDNDKDDDDDDDERHFKGIYDNGQASYLVLSGTSMAAPRAAGVAALMLAANPGLSANMVKMAMQFTARVLPGVDVLTQGAGALNRKGAVLMAQSINPRARHGAKWLTTALPLTNKDSNGKTVTWGQNIVWGDRFMASSTASVRMARWDDNVVWGFDALMDNVVWGNCDGCDNVVWGNNWDDNIVWGNDWDDNIVWGNNVVWGFDNIVWGYWADNIVWGFWDDNVVWGNVHRYDLDNVVWGNDWDNIVWGNCSAARNDDNVVWGNNDDNVVWGNDDNIVWGFDDGDNVVWGNNDCFKKVVK
jgi:serine protease AprX